MGEIKQLPLELGFKQAIEPMYESRYRIRERANSPHGPGNGLSAPMPYGRPPQVEPCARRSTLRLRSPLRPIPKPNVKLEPKQEHRPSFDQREIDAAQTLLALSGAPPSTVVKQEPQGR